MNCVETQALVLNYQRWRQLVDFSSVMVPPMTNAVISLCGRANIKYEVSIVILIYVFKENFMLKYNGKYDQYVVEKHHTIKSG